ncbi:hypothetical protein QZH41_001501 [Actinostola sp. cb2023]|nr:hypothetical protein QZH41_001501 [Actinostola sp. cb2023]
MNARGNWVKDFDFLLALIGGSVGFGNVWRFPYLCYKNGGELRYKTKRDFETALSVYNDGVGRKYIPGIGYASTVLNFYFNTYYAVILAWSFMYLFYSFTKTLPWSHCNNDWNTAACYVGKKWIPYNVTLNGTQNYTTKYYEANDTTTSINEFWQKKVLTLSDGLDDIGSINWKLALCLLLAWIVCYFCVWKGVRSSGRVWLEAATQVFFSYSIGQGVLIALGSYNKYKHNFYSCLTLCTLMMVSVERYLAIEHPNFYQANVTTKTTMITMSIVWVTMTTVLVTGRNLVDADAVQIPALVTLGPNVLIVLFCTIKVQVTAYRHRRAIAQQAASVQQEEQQNRLQEYKRIFTMSMLVLASVLFYSPLFITAIIKAIKGKDVPGDFKYISQPIYATFIYLQSLVNPLIMSLRLSYIRQGVYTVACVTSKGEGDPLSSSHSPFGTANVGA